MDAVILVGGQGTRLRPLTDTRPKPMIALADRPFVEYQLDLLRRHGISTVVFACGYRTESLEEHFGSGDQFGMTIRYVVDPHPLGTAGAIKNAQPVLSGTSRIVVLNGDILTDLDIDALVAAHEAAGVLGTLTLTTVSDPSRYGLVRCDESGRVSQFVEKPVSSDGRLDGPFLINAGTYLFEPQVLDTIPDGQACSIERDIFPGMAAAGQLAGYVSDAYWRDIGTHESYLQANLDVLASRVNLDAPHGDFYVADGAQVADTAKVTGGSCIGAGAVVNADVRVHESVVLDGAHLEAGARLERAIVGAGAHVGAGAYLGAGTVVGDKAVIGPNVSATGTSIETSGHYE